MKNTSEPVSESVIDTTGMSLQQRAALELAESSRDSMGARRTVAASLFLGDVCEADMFPFPRQDPESEREGDAFLEKLRFFLETQVNPDEIDSSGEIPNQVLEGLAEIGAFGMKIPKKYGGLGLSQTTYSRAAMLLGGFCGNLTALLSAHQSIGVPQPLLVFGTEAQKQKFLPRAARGEISAFALTESDVGSDPARMATTAEWCEDEGVYTIHGEKLWCTNGVKAGVIVLMAKMKHSPPDRPIISAFLVEMNTPGVKVVRRCYFMGLKALYNGVIRFENVKVTRDSLIAQEGRGLKVALTTLNTGRITLPAACVGLATRCLEWVTEWSRSRVQWGFPIGQHDAIAQKIARMAADTYAVESMVRYVSAQVDRSKTAEIRIEAALAKLWGTERAWRIMDDTMQIRGGRGYETAASLAARGEKPVPVERFFRDCRINTIFEGSSEIMRLFIAREALDPHLRVGAPVLDKRKGLGERVKAAGRAAAHYAVWLPKRYLPVFNGGGELPEELRRDWREVRCLSKKLARRLFRAMVRYGPALEKRQSVLGRFVDIGAELFAMATTISRAAAQLKSGERKRDELLPLVRYFCCSSRLTVERLFTEIRKNADLEGMNLAQGVLKITHNE